MMHTWFRRQRSTDSHAHTISERHVVCAHNAFEIYRDDVFIAGKINHRHVKLFISLTRHSVCVNIECMKCSLCRDSNIRWIFFLFSSFFFNESEKLAVIEMNQIRVMHSCTYKREEIFKYNLTKNTIGNVHGIQWNFFIFSSIVFVKCIHESEKLFQYLYAKCTISSRLYCV